MEAVMEAVKVGDIIKIVSINDTANDWYAGKVGIVENICKDPWGDTRIEGTWGGLCLYPHAGDKFLVLKKGGEQNGEEE